MNFNTKTEKTTQWTSPKFNVGWNQAKIENISIKTATTGKKQLKFQVYGPPITTEGFKPFMKADKVTPYAGQCGLIQTFYFDDTNEEAMSKVISQTINPIAVAFGVKEQLDEITSSGDITSLEKFVDVLNRLFTNEDLPYVWMNFSGSEYEKPGSTYPGYTLSFRNIVKGEPDFTKMPAGIMKTLAPKAEDTSTDVVF
jgi:hypothetical protein